MNDGTQRSSCFEHEASLRSRFIDGMAGHLAATAPTRPVRSVARSSIHNPAARADRDVERCCGRGRSSKPLPQQRGHLEASVDELAALETVGAELRGDRRRSPPAEARDRGEP